MDHYAGKNVFAKVLKFVVLAILLLFVMMPFIAVLLNAFKNNADILDNPFSLPKSLSFANFTNAIQTMNFFHAIWNTVFISVISVALVVIFSSMTAYYLARHKGTLSKVIFMVLVVSMIIPFQAIMIPLVSIYGSLGLLNSKWILIYLYIGSGAAMAIFMYHGFIVSDVPIALEEAATLDGCNSVQTFFLIVLPLLKAMTSTMVILDLLWFWNDYLLPSLVLINPNERTLSLSTYAFYGSHSVDYGPLMASLLLCVIPIIVVFLVMQKRIISGVIAGAVKS